MTDVGVDKMPNLETRPIIFLEPIFKEMIWGGKKLETEFNYKILSDNTGECWAIAAHENGVSKIVCDEFKGYTLSKLWQEHRELFGNLKGDVFPLLVKIIDAKKDLSIQVHPDDTYAQYYENGSLGKTECWYVLDCEENTTIIIGHNAKDSLELRKMTEENRWAELLREVKIKKGDFFQIDPGCIHAINGGTMILETQQNSDITYRLYDYDRVSADGKPRELHTEKALAVIKSPFKMNNADRNITEFGGYSRELLVKCPYYSVEKLTIREKAEILQEYNFMNVSVVEGCGMVDGKEIKKGTHFVLPYDYGFVEFTGKMELIISYL